MENNSFENDFDNSIDLKTILNKYLVHWQWFLLTVVMCLLSAFFYLRYVIPQYTATATILVKDEQKGGMLSELSAFADMGIGGGMKSNLDNEIEILKSRSLTESTVKKLNLYTSLIVKGKVSDIEIYNDAPISVNFIDKSNNFYEQKINLTFTGLNSNKFKLEDELATANSKVILSSKNEFSFGEQIALL
jgi:tyrosine-protein kinase Etk/Wzc